MPVAGQVQSPVGRAACAPVRGGPGGRAVTTLPGMTSPSSWTWRLHDPAGETLDPAAVGVVVPVEDAQAEAESWLGEHWRDLLERGVATVSLLRGDAVVYGPMGLAAG